MRKLLFAPDDPRTCRAWETAVQSYQGVWESHLVQDAASAQNGLAEGNWDAVVAHLASERGLSLLAQAREAFPEAVRIGVVPFSQLKAPHPSFVHQVVCDPLDLKELEAALERSCRLRDLLRGERICQTVGELGELPSAPGVYLHLMESLNSADSSIGEVAEIIEGDVGASARLLQLVNSVIFRTSREIITVRMAVGFLGLNVIKNVVLSMEALQAFDKIPSVPGFSQDELQSHGRLTAAIAAHMELPGDVRDAAIVAALLHDIGKLVLAYKMPDRFARLLARARAEQKPLYRIEEELWGITHAEIGAYLLGLWGLPLQVTEAIAYHHAPAAVPHQRFDALAALYVANLLAHEAEDAAEGTAVGDAARETAAAERTAEEKAPGPEWDMPFLEGLGVRPRLAGWKTMARELAATQESATAGAV
jgi:putative nucleotidyltransferase with HDIG domain